MDSQSFLRFLRQLSQELFSFANLQVLEIDRDELVVQPIFKIFKYKLNSILIKK